jgi:HAD superfamily hydrolase (TIGR01484 family)
VIKVFVTDIDGCLATPYEPYDLEGFATLRRLVGNAGPPTADHPAPAVSVCSGRPYPYVEAITQALAVTVPVLFEGGGGRFDPVAAQATWNPALTDEIEAEIEEVRHWFVTECVPGTKMSIDHAKRTQAGVVSPDPDDITALRPRAEAFVAENVPDLRVFSTKVSIDVVPPGITKKTGLEWLTDHLGVDMSAVAYIGDADSDLEALAAAGMSFAPANADEEVLRTVDHVTDGAVLDGTLEAYRWCRTQNGA